MKNSSIFYIVCLALILIPGGCSKSRKTIVNLKDIEDASIGAMTGTTGEAIAKKKFPRATIKIFDDIMDAVAALKSSHLDAVITGFPAAMNVARHNPDLICMKEAVDYENTAIAVRKGNDRLLSDIDGVLSELKNDGTLIDMRRRWFKTDLSPYEDVTIDLPKKGEILKIGTSATREPFAFVDDKGNISGHDGELGRRIGAKLGRPIEFVNMKFMALIPALQSGKIDIIATGMTETKERRKSINFSQSYFDNCQIFIVKKTAGKEPAADHQNLNLKTVADLKNKRIGVLLGSVHDKYVTRNYPNATVLQYNSPPEIVLAARSGKIDAGMQPTEIMRGILKKDPDLQLFGDPVFYVPIAFGFRKDNGALREQFNVFLSKIKEAGIFDDMKDRWVTKGSDEMPAIKAVTTNGTLIVGTMSNSGLPFTTVKNNKLAGFDVELTTRFAAYLGKELKWADMQFGSLIASVSTGKIDMVGTMLMVTEERRKLIDFSDEYMQLGSSFYVLKKNVAAYEKSGVNKRGSPAVTSFFTSAANSFHNNIILENRYLLILDGLKTTVIISILSIVFGTILGGFVCFMRMSRNKYLSAIAKLYISILRGTPVLVLLMIIFYVIFASVNINPVIVAVIAFGLNFAAYVSEMYRSGIEGVDKGQTEAGIAIGFTRIKTFAYIVMPQATRLILPVYKGEVISLVKMTSIVGYIAVQDLTKASDIIRSRTFDAFFPLIMVAVLYFIIAWLIMILLGYVERMANPQSKMRRGTLR
jgi:polar amino acid transport system substrate-binding protein